MDDPGVREVPARVLRGRAAFAVRQGINGFASGDTEMLRPAVYGVAATLLAGCASTIGAAFNRPVVEDSVKNAVSTVSLAADRRTVVVVTEGANRTKFCAEPPPDTATGLKTELEAALEAEARQAEAQGKLDLKDKLETTVTVIAERTAPLDAFRTGVYALCQYYLNGAISKEDVRPLFEKLIDSFHGSQLVARQGSSNAGDGVDNQ